MKEHLGTRPVQEPERKLRTLANSLVATPETQRQIMYRIPLKLTGSTDQISALLTLINQQLPDSLGIWLANTEPKIINKLVDQLTAPLSRELSNTGFHPLSGEQAPGLITRISSDPTSDQRILANLGLYPHGVAIGQLKSTNLGFSAPVDNVIQFKSFGLPQDSETTLTTLNQLLGISLWIPKS